MFRSVILLTVSTFVFLGTGCDRGAVDSSQFSDALILVEGAQHPNYVKYLGTDQLSYTVSAQYPAKEVIDEIHEKLEAKGWKPLPQDFLPPQTSSSHVIGWTYFVDGTNRPEREVRQWLAQWENPPKEILNCVLRYTYPKGTRPNLKNLGVTLIFIPSELATQMKKTAEDYNRHEKLRSDQP